MKDKTKSILEIISIGQFTPPLPYKGRYTYSTPLGGILSLGLYLFIIVQSAIIMINIFEMKEQLLEQSQMLVTGYETDD